MAQHDARIMVVDDETTARVSLAEILRLEGYQISTAASGEEALSLLEKSEPFDLLVLDIKMPGIDGLTVAEKVREEYANTSIILLTAFGTLETAIEAVRKGADDYLLKPSSVPEILESVHKALGRQRQEQKRQQLVSQLQQTVSQLIAVEGAGDLAEEGTGQPARFLEVRDMVIDRQKHIVTRAGDAIDLTPTEFKILECLMETPDQVWSPQDLVRQAQGYETDAWGARAIIRVHIRRLRKKVEQTPSDPTYIINMRGVGYMFASTEDAPDA